MNFRALDAAQADLRAAAHSLETQRSGTGARFLRAYYEASENIERFPQLYPLVEDEVPAHEIRNAILERFGYRIVYLVRHDEVVILTLTHTSRRPGHWHRRLDDNTLS